MKIKLELQHNNKTSCREIDYNDFSTDKIEQYISNIPNFRPKLESFQEEEQKDKFSIMKFCYTNLSKNADKLIVRVIPMFSIMESLSHKNT